MLNGSHPQKPQTRDSAGRFAARARAPQPLTAFGPVFPYRGPACLPGMAGDGVYLLELRTAAGVQWKGARELRRSHCGGVQIRVPRGWLDLQFGHGLRIVGNLTGAPLRQGPVHVSELLHPLIDRSLRGRAPATAGRSAA